MSDSPELDCSMRQPIHDEAIELLLTSMTQEAGTGYKASFLYNKPGEISVGRLGEELYYRQKEMTRTALYVRKIGPLYLRAVPLSDIESMLKDFIAEQYWHIFGEILFNRFKGTYAERLSPDTKQILAESLAHSKVFQPRLQLALFPLIPIQVQHEFDEGPYFIRSPGSLATEAVAPFYDPEHVVPDSFPPISGYESKNSEPQISAWLGVRAPAYQAAEKIKAAVLGALALTPSSIYRHQFSAREMRGGRCVLAGGAATISPFVAPHTPPLSSDIVITEADQSWMKLLANKLMSPERAVRRQLRALEYFYRAWPLDPADRFSIFCMTLDAVFGDVSHATQAVIDGVREVLGSHISDARLRALTSLRAAVIHGAAPDVYDSSKYTKYYDRYGVDPISDLELVVAGCLRRIIFDGILNEHPDPYADVIAEERAKGTLPKLDEPTILDG